MVKLIFKNIALWSMIAMTAACGSSGGGDAVATTPSNGAEIVNGQCIRGGTIVAFSECLNTKNYLADGVCYNAAYNVVNLEDCASVDYYTYYGNCYQLIDNQKVNDDYCRGGFINICYGEYLYAEGDDLFLGSCDGVQRFGNCSNYELYSTENSRYERCL